LPLETGTTTPIPYTLPPTQENRMIELHYWPTPNGHKVTMFLEEAGLPYEIKPVNIGRGDQFKPEYLKISPNNKMPAMVDTDPLGGGESLSIFESGAILLYLTEKTGKFIPASIRERYVVMEWLFWQVGGLGPMLGQNHHFNRYAPEKIPYAIDRYVNETRRLYGVLDQRLAGRDFIAGSDYGIADMAAYPWIVPYEAQTMHLEDFPNVQRWFKRIGERDATKRAYALGETIKEQVDITQDEEARKHLFGQGALKK
jgi:GSH-dependent disulfide-bond oxidoreductase